MMQVEEAPLTSGTLGSIEGIFVAIATPFQTTGRLDLAKLADLIVLLQREGVRGILAAGSQGERRCLARFSPAKSAADARLMPNDLTHGW